MERLRMAVLLLSGVAVSPAWAMLCLPEENLRSASSSDGKTLVMRMRDGKVWSSRLKGDCPSLKFNGFVWLMHDPQGICEDSQSLQVLQSGQICILGKFLPLSEH
jgi:hypothetical protein